MRRLCLALGILALSFGGTTLAPAESEAALICPHYFCRNTTECQMMCPEASSALCVNFVCQYTY